MLDLTTLRGRLVAAALRLAEERPWHEVTLSDIAEAGGTNLVALRKEFGSKSDVLAAFARAIDDEVLIRAPKRVPGQAARDAIFEVLMSRFDALAPYKTALGSIAKAGTTDATFIKAFLSSQAWMLQAAGVPAEGLGGAAKVAGLASVYASVFRTWLDDDDPGQARTMAALDRRLRRGERMLTTVDDAAAAWRRVISILRPKERRPGESAPSSSAEGSGSSETPPGSTL